MKFTAYDLISLSLFWFGSSFWNELKSIYKQAHLAKGTPGSDKENDILLRRPPSLERPSLESPAESVDHSQGLPQLPSRH